ncbi:MAG TPA: hypothetical protein VK465_05710, partial [Fibrobacteria bacterium]|nr:hypothetical protein [Fibrobacteria bacterium]
EYLLAVVNGAAKSILRFKSVGSNIERAANDVYKREYDESPYVTASLPATNFGKITYNPAALKVALSLLE